MTQTADSTTPKITDVAREAEVSVATVSRVLNNSVTVSPELADRVRTVTERLGYRRNMTARSLRRRSSDAIALIISDVSNPFFTAVAQAVEDVAQKSGYSVLLCNSYEDVAREATYFDVAEAQQVAGVVLSPHAPTADVSRLRNAGIPIVVIDRHLPGPYDSVFADSREGARAATSHLIAEGWKRPACITGLPDTETSEERIAGYRDAVEAAGLDAMIASTTSLQESSGIAAAQLLDAENPPDSLFIAHVHMALGVFAELARRKLTIGEDIGIVAFDDAPWAPFIGPGISAVAQPAYEVGSKAAELLFERMADGSREPQSIVLPTTLIPRGSSHSEGSAN